MQSIGCIVAIQLFGVVLVITLSTLLPAVNQHRVNVNVGCV